MKRYNLFAILIAAVAFTGCNFLDKNPDLRTEIDSQEKVRQLLASAYNTCSYGPVGEYCSDNIVDNNTPDAAMHVNTEESFSQMYDQLFAWEDVTTDSPSEQDSPSYIWQACYNNIAIANQALEAISKLAAQGVDVKAEEAEARMLRAYNHFILVNIFCQAYRDENLSRLDSGVPFMSKTEDHVTNLTYHRSTVTAVYDSIQHDIEQALPYISDGYYSVPKYHFNPQAAKAFAARFFLFTRQYDKVIDLANQVLGSDPSSLMWDAKTCKELGNIEQELYAWMNAASNSNFLIQTTNSLQILTMGLGYYRYTFNRDARDFTIANGGPDWDGNFPGANVWRANANYGGFFSKMYYLFEYTDKVAQIGYYHGLRREFTSGELLLTRAEARIMKGDIAGAVNDMNIWSKGYLGKGTMTEQSIRSYFKENKNKQQTPELHNQDMCPSWIITPEQRPFVWCVLHLRRIETLHDGMRWFDIKRYGIEIDHTISTGTKVTDVVTKHLVWNDSRRALQLPQTVIDAVASGRLTPNDRKAHVGDAVGAVLSNAPASRTNVEILAKMTGYTITIDEK